MAQIDPRALAIALQTSMIQPVANVTNSPDEIMQALEGAPGNRQLGGGTGNFPAGYHQVVPREMRMSRVGISHPGFRWEVFDKQTGDTVRSGLQTRSGAMTSVNKLDNQYGGYRYQSRPVPAQPNELTDQEKDFLGQHFPDMLGGPQD